VREAVRYNPALRLLLKRVVADRLRSGHALLDVTGLETVAIGGRPDTGETISLQLQANGQRIALARTGALLCTRNLARRADQILDVVTEFMRDDIVLRKVAARAEPVGQLVEEAGVEEDPVVGRAVEGAHRRLCRTATRTTIFVEEAELGRLELFAVLREDRGPGLLRRAEGVARGASLGVQRADRLRVGAGTLFAAAASAALRYLPGGCAGRRAATQHATDIAEPTEQRHHDQHDDDAAAPETAADQWQQAEQKAAASTARTAAAALILDVDVGVEIVEPHGLKTFILEW